MKVISAKEANTKTFEVISNRASKELDEIMNNIQNEINGGHFYYSGNDYLYEDTKKRLEELGYKVTIGSQYNEPYYIISWENI